MRSATLTNDSILTGNLKPVSLVILLLFFCNTFLMPHGLSLSFFLAPVFLYYIFQSKKSLRILAVFLLILAGFDCIHFLNGVQISSFLKSNVLLISTFISFVAAYQYFRSNREKIALHFKQINLYNFFFCLLALLFLFIPILNSIFWSHVSMGHQFSEIPRLQLFSPEPSHYALLLSPILLYFILSFLLSAEKKRYLPALVIITIPFLFSFSFGNFTALGLSILVTLLVFRKQLLLNKSNLRIFFVLIVTLSLSLLTLYFFWPDSFIFKRIGNVLRGTDTSANGRTFQSFGLAWHLAKTKSAFWGIGLGQIKELAGIYYRDFFPYISTIPNPVRIPNASAEILATFGIFGLILKIGATGLVFFYKRLYKNMYCTALFVFIFAFQFTGSYLINFTEMFIWALIFANPFQKFNS